MTTVDSAGLLAEIIQPVQQVLASVADVGRTLLGTAAGLGGQRRLRRSDCATLQPLVADLLRRHHGLAAGAGVVLAPDALEDAPLWIQWWWADQRGRVRQLDVDLDPASAEFYDYTTTEWYRGPAGTGQPWVAGPYVDYICTHQYTFTLSVPVAGAAGLLGVAGADILAAQVERLALPVLARLRRPVALASGDGRVIASTTPRVLPGTLLPGSPPPAAGPFPWVLVEDEGTQAG